MKEMEEPAHSGKEGETPRPREPTVQRPQGRAGLLSPPPKSRRVVWLEACALGGQSKSEFEKNLRSGHQGFAGG